MKKYEKKLDLNEKETAYVKKLVKLRNDAYTNLYNFHLQTQSGFTGKPDSKNDKAVKELWQWSKDLLDKNFDFPQFIKSIKNIKM